MHLPQELGAVAETGLTSSQQCFTAQGGFLDVFFFTNHNGLQLFQFFLQSHRREQSPAASSALHLLQVSPHHQLSHNQQKYGVCQTINICLYEANGLSGDICVNVTKSAPKLKKRETY